MRSTKVATLALAWLLGTVVACSDDKPTQPTLAQPVATGSSTASGSTARPPDALLPPEVATVTFSPLSGSQAQGTVRVEQRDDGVWLTGNALGLSPGKHGFHVHENGDCSAPDGSSAGAHFAAASHLHGAPTDADHHAGDLGNVEADADGTATIAILAKDVTLTGNRGIVDRSLVIHGAEDDLTAQPSGNSGPPVACGVIRGN